MCSSSQGLRFDLSRKLLVLFIIYRLGPLGGEPRALYPSLLPSLSFFFLKKWLRPPGILPYFSPRVNGDRVMRQHFSNWKFLAKELMGTKRVLWVSFLSLPRPCPANYSVCQTRLSSCFTASFLLNHCRLGHIGIPSFNFLELRPRLCFIPPSFSQVSNAFCLQFRIPDFEPFS